MAQNNFHDDFDKNSQEAPGRARFIRQRKGRDAVFKGLLELPVERA